MTEDGVILANSTVVPSAKDLLPQSLMDMVIESTQIGKYRKSEHVR
jgi:hypothetical protein